METIDRFSDTVYAALDAAGILPPGKYDWEPDPQTWCASCRTQSCGAHQRAVYVLDAPIPLTQAGRMMKDAGLTLDPITGPDVPYPPDWLKPIPSPEDVAAAQAILGYDPFEDGLLHCDYCDKVEHVDDLDMSDWNGETGCHRTCEERKNLDALYGQIRAEQIRFYSGNGRLIAASAISEKVTPNGGDITVTWDAKGILTLGGE